MARSRNPRCVVLEMLRNVKKNVNSMIVTWNQRQTMWDGSRWVKRSTSRVEDDRDEWLLLIQYMDCVIFEADAVRQYARDQVDRLT